MPDLHEPISKKTDKLKTSSLKPRVESFSNRSGFTTSNKIGQMLRWSPDDLISGRYRMMLYRFLSEHVPVVSSCLWTWARISSAKGRYELIGSNRGREDDYALDRLRQLHDEGYADQFGNRVGFDVLLPDLFMTLYRDGMYGGIVTVNKDASGIDKFIPVDLIDLSTDKSEGNKRLFLEAGGKRVSLERPDFYHIAFNSSTLRPLGQSLLKPIPFVSYVEQQLVDDMRRSSHNSGFHRMHIRITPPEKQGGESDKAYTERINGYFDSTVRMIKDCEIDDNPVTWDNVAIEYIGADKGRAVTNSWFINHRAMIEEVCAGTNLAPFLLGYSYGATTTWSDFKFDVVMRQVRSVQSSVGRFLEWLGNIELALAGSGRRCQFVFDNSFAYQAKDNLSLQTSGIDNLLKLLEAGLIDKKTAQDRACRLI